jgi:hypothetical protein
VPARSRRTDLATIALALAVVALVSWPTPPLVRRAHAIVAWALLPEPRTP